MSGPHRVAFALLLVGDREHALVDARLDELRRDDRRRAPDAAGRVHPDHRLPGCPERIGEIELGHHRALEHVGCLADDDRVDVAPADARVLERTIDRLAQQARQRDVRALDVVLGLTDPDDCATLCH
jgi:hypothetical protein